MEFSNNISIAAKIRKSVSTNKNKVIGNDFNNIQTLNEIMNDYENVSIKQRRIKVQLKGTHNK